MIYAFLGTDRYEVIQKSQSLIAKLHQKKPDAEIFYIDGAEWSESHALQFSGEQGLFEKKYIVVIRDVLDQSSTAEIFFDHADLLKNSEHIFIVIGNNVSSASVKKLEKYAEKIQVIETQNTLDSQKDTQVFAITDALGSGRTLQAWNLYRQALDRGNEPEQIHGILWWYIKSLIIASQSRSASESKLNPYVYSKAQKTVQRIGGERARIYAENLIDMYHSARRGETDLALEIERFILQN